MIHPAPKPAPKEKRPRKKIEKSSKKIRPNAKRKKRLFREDFDSPEFLAMIKNLPCEICGVEGFTVAAHLTSRGAGGKACDVAPLCRSRSVMCIIGGRLSASAIEGCHEAYDAHRFETRQHEERLRLSAEKRWVKWQDNQPKEESAA